jgi:cholest-4-en-3-one 26-monooxygenase
VSDVEIRDLFDPEVFEHGMPHADLAWVRAHRPVYWQPAHDGPAPIGMPEQPDQRGFWLITGYEDVQRVSRDQASFSSERGTTVVRDMDAQTVEQLRLWMINQDHPRHTRLRKLINSGFTPRMIHRMEGHIRDLTRGVVDGVARKGECDFVAEVAAELPLLVIAELVGAPVADRGKLFEWSNALIGFEDPELGEPLSQQNTMLEMFEYAGFLAKQRRDDPREDLTSLLVHAEVDGEQLGELGFNMFFVLLILAGNETTRNAISGGMVALSEHPAEQARLVADHGLLPRATEEILRFVSPVIYMRRTATRDTELHGTRIAENDKVVLCYPAANRDPRVFDAPDVFDVSRDPNPHLAFGYGPHYCLGANLARMEIQCMFDELLRRLPDIHVSGPVRRLRSTVVNSVKSLPVRFTPETRGR